jgi:hypothetical protein
VRRPCDAARKFVTKARASVLKILAAHGLGKSPYRVDSAGNHTYIFAISYYDGPCARQSKPLGGELDPAVSFDTCTRDPYANFKSHVVRIDGEWVNGSPLTVKYESLPKLEDIDVLWSEIDSELGKHAPPCEPAPKWEPPQQVYKRADMEPYSAAGAINPAAHANPWDNRARR